MKLVSSGFVRTMNRSWKPRRYQRGGHKSASKTVTLGGSRNHRFWKIKPIRRLRLKKVSLIRLWIKLKNAYVDLMLRLGGTENVFRSKRAARRLQLTGGYSVDDFHSRLIYEISKNLIASRELATL